jgi:hypothetical protein
MVLNSFHREACAQSRQRYLDSRDPEQAALDWQEALHEARTIVANALRASDNLRDVATALTASGRHMLAFRQLLSPPLSQDQFKLICPDWLKGSEKSGRPLPADAARAVAEAVHRWRSRRLTPWIEAERAPAASEVDSLLLAAATLIALQQLSTARRNRIAREQEEAVTALLTEMGWQRLPSRLIDQRAQVPAKHFMHKSRFASGPNENQEVDIACGLGGTVVLAMECKVTNDETNSVKRVNDVLKKAAAWKHHWGNFVQPAAMLQGVLKPEDVQRLLDGGVQVFWSHRLDVFAEWIQERSSQD